MYAARRLADAGFHPKSNPEANMIDLSSPNDEPAPSVLASHAKQERSIKSVPATRCLQTAKVRTV